MAATGASVRIELTGWGEPRYGLRFVRYKHDGKVDDEIDIRQIERWEVAKSARADLQRSLQQVREAYKPTRRPDAPLDVASASQVMTKLITVGKAYLATLLGYRPWERASDVQELLRPVRPNVAGAAPLMEVVGSETEMIPVEILPLFGMADRDLSTAEDLRQVALDFPGFAAVVHRSFPYPIEQGKDLPVDTLQLKFFHYADRLKGVKRQLTWLKSKTGVKVDGPWPTGDPDASTAAAVIVKHLKDPGLKFDVASDELPDDVQHFACHADTTHDVSGENVIILRGQGEDIPLTLQNLKAATMSRSARTPARPAPLVFVNACGSSRIDPRGYGSLVSFFLTTIGNTTFVGAEANVPDSVAAAFSLAFYEHLLEGHSVGAAVRGARWSLLERLNPLGILYAVYGDAGLTRSRTSTTSGTI